MQSKTRQRHSDNDARHRLRSVGIGVHPNPPEHCTVHQENRKPSEHGDFQINRVQAGQQREYDEGQDERICPVQWSGQSAIPHGEK